MKRKVIKVMLLSGDTATEQRMSCHHFIMNESSTVHVENRKVIRRGEAAK